MQHTITMEIQYHTFLLIVQSGSWQFGRKITAIERQREIDRNLILIAISGILLFLLLYL